MPQGLLPFLYEVEKKSGGMTALAGLPPYLELSLLMGLGAAIEKRLGIRSGEQGWTDVQTEQDLILHSESRDGNVWAGTDNLRVLQEALAVLPEGVLAVSLRTDTAGYQHDMMSY